MTTYVTTIGDTPTAAGTDLDAVLAHALATETQHSRPGRTLRWDQYAPDVWRLMARFDGKGRWSWTSRAVHAVPTIQNGGR